MRLVPIDSPEHCLNSLMFSKADSASAEERIAGSGCSDAIVYLSVFSTFGGSLGGAESCQRRCQRPQILLNGLLARSLPRDHRNSTAAGTHIIVASYTSVTGAEYANERMHSDIDTNMHFIKVVIVVTSSHPQH
jgi:hypothetical protein